ncbi:hypothetical protein N327_05100, partial [Fulmarus glacialis]
SPSPAFTSCCTYTPCSWLDSWLCANGLHCLLLMEDRRIYNDVDLKNLEVKLKFLMTKICIK